MFPKINRLQLRQDKSFFKTANRKSSPFFQVFWKKSDQVEPLFAVIVPKKVSLKSTVRHKLLRQMRHILIHSKGKFEHKQAVFVLFHSSLKKNVAELENEVSKLFL